MVQQWRGSCRCTVCKSNSGIFNFHCSLFSPLLPIGSHLNLSFYGSRRRLIRQRRNSSTARSLSIRENQVVRFKTAFDAARPVAASFSAKHGDLVDGACFGHCVLRDAQHHPPTHPYRHLGRPFLRLGLAGKGESRQTTPRYV